MIRINFAYLRMLYDARLCNKDLIRQAVADERISPEQYERITGDAYVEPEQAPAEDNTDG